MSFTLFDKKNFLGVQINNSIIVNAQGHTKGRGQISCDLVLEHQDYNIAVVDLPSIPSNEMNDAMSWEAKRIFSDYEDSLLFDYYPQPSNNQSSKQLVNIVSVEKSHIERIKKIAHSDNVHLSKITIPEMVYKDKISEFLNSNSVCIVVIHADMGKVIIIENNTLSFSRKFGLTFGGDSDGMSYEDLMLLEIQRSLDYYERQYRLSMPSSFILLGDDRSDVEKVDAIVKESISNNVINLPLWDENTLNGKKLSMDHKFLLCATSAGRHQ